MIEEGGVSRDGIEQQGVSNKGNSTWEATKRK